jgi:hypothetical protein
MIVDSRATTARPSARAPDTSSATTSLRSILIPSTIVTVLPLDGADLAVGTSDGGRDI